MHITSCPRLASRRANAVIAFKCPGAADTVTPIRMSHATPQDNSWADGTGI